VVEDAVVGLEMGLEVWIEDCGDRWGNKRESSSGVKTYRHREVCEEVEGCYCIVPSR
jgi:hypothetical protein